MSQGPTIDLDWEEGLFRLARGLVRKVLRREAPRPEGEVRLEDVAARLSALGSLVAGLPLEVRPARDRGGVRGLDLLVPEALSISSVPEDNGLAYVVRVVLTARMAGDALLGSRATPPGRATMAGRDEGSLAAVERAVASLTAEYPGFAAAWARARALEGEPPLGESRLWGPIIEPPVDPGGAVEMPGEGSHDDGGVTTEIEAPPVEELTIHRMKEDPLDLPVHAFEKVEMAESFGGTFRRPDGSDELDDHLEALEEVDLGHLLRGGPETRSAMKAELSLGADVPDVAHVDPGEPFVAYDEWDGRRTRYRRDWCRVIPTAMPPGDGRWAAEALGRHRRTIDRLEAELARHRGRLDARPRSLHGEDLDLDALSRALAAVRAGRTPTRRVWVEQARARRDLATVVLLDVSLSTDGWIDGRRVLDVAKESVLVLGEVTERLGDELEVLAFASHTRHRVRCWAVREASEPWSRGRSRLGLLEPQGYTRIGPALRHATDRLFRSPARHKLLLLLSDCKPTDYDRYEGRHGMADVHKALHEARQRHVHVHALAIDSVASSWLASMFPPGQWAVLPTPERLPEALTLAYGRCA